MYNISGITVEELLDLDIMNEGKILAGKKGLTNVITKVNVMEVPDIINWVEEGEFLLTTAFSMKDDLEGFRDLIIHLKEKGLAGLGIKTKRYIKEVPMDVLKIADDLGFPLIEISYDLSYSTIITGVLTEIVNNQTNKLYRIEFLDDLLSKEEARHKKAIEIADYFDFDTSLSYSVIVISNNTTSKSSKFNPRLTDYLYQINRRLFSIINRIIKNSYPKLMLGNKSNKIIILYGNEQNDSIKKVKEDISAFCNEIIKYAKFESIIDNIVIGIGGNYSDSMELWRSYNEANRAIEYLHRVENKRLAYFDELGIYRILSYEEIRPDLIQIYNELLGSLIKYDKEKGTEFIDTLKNYFKYAGNLKKISGEMFTHYNTIVYRIQRVKEITGIDFDDYDDRLNLQIALKIHDMIKAD